MIDEDYVGVSGGKNKINFKKLILKRIHHSWSGHKKGLSAKMNAKITEVVIFCRKHPDFCIKKYCRWTSK